MLAKVRAALGSMVTCVAFGAAGCRCNDRPYVPYTIGSGAASATAAPSNAPTPSPTPSPTSSAARPVGSADAGAFLRVNGQAAPKGALSWVLGGMTVQAPPNRLFVTGLALQTGGQPAQVAAFVGDGGSMAGDVVLYRADAGGRVIGPTTLAKLPEWLPTGQDCTHAPQLSQVGPSTLWLDVASVCKGASARKPDRYVAALSISQTPAVVFEARVGALAPGERLALEADGADVDGDGLDDLTVQVTLEGLPLPLTVSSRATASFKFLGRASGMARDAQQPAASLRQLATWQASQATRKEAAEQALGAARQVRRLFTLLCEESGGAALVRGDGRGFDCGETALVDVATEARFAEARALLTMGNAPAAAAIAARMRDSKGRPKRAADLDAALEASSTVRKAQARPLPTIEPRPGGVALPMVFDAEGMLLVQTDNGQLVRVDPSTGATTPAGDARGWNSLAELSGDLSLQDAVDPCKADFLRLRLKSAATGTRELPLPLLGGSKPSCGEPTVAVALVDRNDAGLTALVGGDPYAVANDGESARPVPWPTGPSDPGTVRSPDGKLAAIASGDRVVVRGGARPELWRPSSRFVFNACTVANQAKAVACLLDHGIVLLTP